MLWQTFLNESYHQARNRAAIEPPTTFMKQLQLDLSSPPKKTRNKLSPQAKAMKKEKAEAHRAFKLLKSNKYSIFTNTEKSLLKKYYNISL